MKIKNSKLLSLVCALLCVILALGATVTFARFSEDFTKGDDTVGIADAVATIKVNSVYRKDVHDNKTTVSFDKSASSVTVYDVEPEDEIQYYFMVSGIEGKRVNEVTMNATLFVTVRLETITENGGKKVDYFAGWTSYKEEDGIKEGAYLKICHGAENEAVSEIRPSIGQQTGVDFSGNTLVTETIDGVTVNKAGLVMAADDAKKDYPFHVIFTLPKQNAEKENYVGARVYFDIKVVAEQAVQA